MKTRRNDLSRWFVDLDDCLWLKGDDTGAQEAPFIVSALGLKSGHSVLDCPCGAGRISTALAKAGCTVTGVDIRQVFLRRARRRFRREGLDGSFLRSDMREIDFAGRFDAVVNWSGSFGYFLDPDNLRVLRRFSLALKPGGRVLIDQLNREYVLRHFHTKMKQGDLTLHSKWKRRTQCIETTWRWRVAGRQRSCRSRIRIYTPGQLGRLFEAAGLRVEAMYGGLDASPYRRGSRRIHIVGRKV